MKVQVKCVKGWKIAELNIHTSESFICLGTRRYLFDLFLASVDHGNASTHGKKVEIKKMSGRRESLTSNIAKDD